MPIYNVFISEHLPQQWQTLESALRTLLTENHSTNYVIRFFRDNPQPNNNDSFIINAEYGLVAKGLNDVANQFENFRYIFPEPITGIGLRWAEVSQDNAV